MEVEIEGLGEVGGGVGEGAHLADHGEDGGEGVGFGGGVEGDVEHGGAVYEGVDWEELVDCWGGC